MSVLYSSDDLLADVAAMRACLRYLGVEELLTLRDAIALELLARGCASELTTPTERT